MAVREAARSANRTRREHGVPEDPNPVAWREQADMVRRESASAYAAFLDSLFFYYRESMRIAETEHDSDARGAERPRLFDSNPAAPLCLTNPALREFLSEDFYVRKRP